MNSRNFLYNAALALGLAASGTALANDPMQMTQQEREAYRAQRQAEMAGMTPEQRAQAQGSHRQGGSAQGQGVMARDGSGSGGMHGGGQGGGQGGGRGRGR